MSVREKIVGVIGGMGPEATVDFMHRLIAATPARDDTDHLRVLVDNNPKVPSRIAALIEQNGEDPTSALCEMAQKLEAHGADFLVIPCNTAHYYLPAIAQSVHIPLLDMVGLSIEKLTAIRPKPTRVGVLASPAVRLIGLYESRMEEAGLTAIFPNPEHEAALLDIIRAVKAGQLKQHHQQRYDEIAGTLSEEGAEVLLIACTELSVMGPLHSTTLRAMDALDALVEATVRTARDL
jgi:aspartate racemase